MNNFWNNRNRPNGPLFAKQGAPTPTPTSNAPPASGSMGQSSSARASAAGSVSPSSSSSKTPAGTKLSLNGKLKFEHDLACGVFVGAFDVPGWIISLEVLEITDPTSGRVERCEGWLRSNDMLAILTREFGKARQKAGAVEIRPDAPPHLRAQLTKEREEWNRRTVEMRDQVVCLLHSRHAYVKADELGVKVLIPAP